MSIIGRATPIPPELMLELSLRVVAQEIVLAIVATELRRRRNRKR